MLRPRMIVSLLCLATMSLSFSQTERRQLIVWGLAAGPESKGLDAQVHEFERRHPDVKVRLLSMGAGAMNPQKLMTSIVGNVAPDVISQDRFSVPDWASRGAFQALDKYLIRDKDDPNCPKKSQYYDAPWAEAVYEGKLYAIPTSADDRILYYNKGLFRAKAAELRAAGLDPERPPRTWSETLAYSKILTEKNADGTLKKAGYLPNYGNTWLYLYAFQNNASFMSEDGRRCTLDSPEAEEALQFMVDGYDQIGGFDLAKSFESGFLGNENDPFIIGKVAMKVDGDWILNSLARYAPEIELGVGPPPVPDDRYFKRGRFANERDTFITWFGGFSYAIPRGARNPDDAWTFIKFVTSTEGRMIDMRAQKAWEQRKGRTYIPRVLANRETNETALRELKPPDAKFAAALAEHYAMASFGRIRPPTFVGQLLWNEHVKAIEAALYHRATPKEALVHGQEVVQRDLDAMFEKERHPVIDLGIITKFAIGLMFALAAASIIWFIRLRLGRLARAEAKWAYIFLSPWLIGFMALTLGPMLASLFFSFTQYDVLNEARWVGGKNYGDLFGAEKSNLYKALGNAIYLAAVGVPLGVMTGLSLALLLNSAARGMRYFRTFFYLPSIVPGVASAVLWAWVLTADPNKGLINSFWQQTLTPWLGITPPGWIQSADWSKPAMIMMGLWGAGSGMILWLAGLKGVPGTLYEAAGIDGASSRQTFWSITFPQLSPIIFFNFVTGFIGSLQEFDRMYIMKPSQDGPIGPDDSLLTPVYYLFNHGFTYFKMGFASSIAWLIFGIILLLTFLQFKLAPRWVHYESEKN